MKRNLSCCEHFEKEIGNKCLEKLGINKNEIQNPAIGPTAQLLNDAGTVSSVMLGLGVGVTLALSIGSFGIGSIVGATVAGVTFTFSKISKTMKKSNAKKLDRKVEVYCHFHLKCIIIDVAKELSRMFEYQLVALKDRSQIDTLAECAVDLMLDLKEGDKFDRDTLLKKVLQDGNIKKRKLLTKDDNKWSAPSVFRKPGLQRTIILTDRAAFTHHVNRNGSCKPGKYGYRGQFLETRKHATQDKENEDVTVTRSQAPTTNENHTCEDPRKELCKECSFNYENSINGEYFVESDIDSHYDESQDELKTYYPIHVLVQCPKILNSFIDSQLQEEELSFANFLKKKFCLPEDRLVQPVYRQHSPGKVPDLQNSDLTGSDFSHSDFTNSCLENCNFTNCVMLFAKLLCAKMSGSIFCDTLISHSNLTEVKADHCIWVKTSLLFSRVDDARFDSVDPSIGGNCLDGTNICFANIQKKGKKRKRK